MSRGSYTLRRCRKERACSEHSYHVIKPGDVYLCGDGPPEADWNTSGKWYLIRACLRCAERYALHNSDTRKQLAALAAVEAAS